MKTVWQAVKRAARSFSQDDAIVLAGALAFFTMLSLAPLLILLVTIGAYIGQDTQDRLVQQVQSTLGSTAGDALNELIANAKAQKVAATWSAVVSIVGSLLAATAVFVHLQKSLNRVFNVRTKAGFLISWLYKRGLSLLMVLGIGALLLVSLVLTSILSNLFPNQVWLSNIITLVVSLALFVLIFALMYKVLPDVRISWKDVWMGGVITAVLFVAAEWGIAKYLAYRGGSSVYGAAGSLFVLLLWAFYSGIVIFFGAELTEAYTECCGDPVEPDKFAEWDDTSPKKVAARKEDEQRQAGTA